VDDLATAEMMQRFYTGMLVRHLPPAAALRSAQRQMAASLRWGAPYYWAGFVIQGEWH
jgi:CHAT domain-containing protein